MTREERIAYNKKWLAEKKAKDPKWAAKRQKAQREAQRRFRADNLESERARDLKVYHAKQADPERADHMRDVQSLRNNERMQLDSEYASRKRKQAREKHHRDSRSQDWQAARSLKKSCERRNISTAEYDEMWAAQDGLCSICGKAETRTQKGKLCRLAIDHNHTTGEIRGLLCSNCNTAIGLLKEDPVMFQSAIQYLGGSPHG